MAPVPLIAKNTLHKYYLETVRYLIFKGEMMKAFLYLKHRPSILDDSKELDELTGTLTARLQTIADLQNYGSSKGKVNFTFINPENVSQITKLNLLKERIKELGLKKLVDIGCYTGYVGRELSKDGIAVHGIDIHPIAIQLAAFEAVGTVATFQLLTAEKLGMTHPGEYDGAILFDVLEHCFNTQLVVDNVEKSLKSGGWVFINLPHPDAEDKVFIMDIDKHEHLWSFSEKEIKEVFGKKKNFEYRILDNEEGSFNWWIEWQI